MQTVVEDVPPGEEKRRLRAELCAARRALPAEQRARAVDALAHAAASFAPLGAAATVAGYVACDGEIDVSAVLERARARGARVVLPRRTPAGPLEMVPADAAACAPRSGPGIVEPRGPAVAPSNLPRPAVALVPAVAFDRRGFRLGRGGGHYDRTIPLLRACGWTIVGVCHAAQLRDALPVEAHDQPVDAILTDAGVLTPCRDEPAASSR